MDKIFPNTNNARLTVMIRSNLEIIRLTQEENDINASIVLNVKTAK